MGRALAMGIVVAGIGVAVAWRRAGPRDPPAFDPYTEDFELSEEVQSHLWEVEQLAFTLINRTTPALSRALRDRKRDLLLKSFAPGFEGTVVSGAGRTETFGALTLTTWTTDDARSADAGAVVDWLLAIRDGFEGAPVVDVHQEGLRPHARAALEGPFDATWTVRFRGDLASGGKGAIDVACALVFERVPDAGMEAWIAGWRTTRRVDRRAGGFLMEETTGRTGIDQAPLFDTWKIGHGETPEPRSLSSHLLDYDRDGRLDLLLCDRRLFLYRGRGDGRFDDVTEVAGLLAPGWNVLGGTVADFDNDGDEDLLLDAARGTATSNVAIENRGDGTFGPVPGFQSMGLAVSYGAVADYDGDGLVDLYLPTAGRLPDGERVARWIGDRTVREGVLLRNLGGWRFVDATAAAGVLTNHRDIFAAAWLDIEPDGDADLLLAHHLGDNLLFLNRGDGTFSERVCSETFGGFSMGIAVGDLDGDGDPDGYLANMSSTAGMRIVQNLREEDYPAGVFPLIRGFIQGNTVLENDGAGGLHQAVVHTAGWAYGPALVDFDGDGRLDVYCPAGFQSVERGKPDG